MQIRINGERRELTAPVNVAALVRDVIRREEAPGVAVAQNGEVVRRNDWQQRMVAEGDDIEILEASAGG